ncbi:MAG: TolC family protein [Bacteroidales bacterium]|nr:TolC family protein [Bacteroidales bacterium]
MRFKAFITLMACGTAAALAIEGPVTLDSCRNMAIESNKQLMITRSNIRKAGYQNKEAFAAYLPAIDFAGGYVYNQREISIFDKDQLLPTKSFDPKTGSYQFNLVTDPATGMPVKGPDGQYIPSEVALIPKEAMTYDIHNVFFGAITLTQPIFMGGKIVAMNNITRDAEQVARQMHLSEVENVIYAVDAAYWQVVSLKAKYRLASSYVNLLDSLSHNVHLMFDQGVVTRSDVLSVDVKLNSAQVDLTKVENGLVLSRMALAQVCGLPVNETFTLADEDKDSPELTAEVATSYNMADVYARRPDLEALRLGVGIMGHKKRLAMAEMLPNVALIGAYSFSNPNMFDGFSKKFKGAFSVGVSVTVPIWHWGGNYNRYRAAEVDETVMRLQLDDARTLVDLQVQQASFKTTEAYKTYNMTEANLAQANENLRCANLAFREGMATTDNVLEAQTAWLKAHSEQIDAMIDVRLCNVYLSKCLGTLY